MKKDKSKLLAVFLVLLTIIVVVVSAIMKNNKTEESKISIVTNPSNFFTVNSCLNRTITYAFKKDEKALLSVIDDSYKKNNKITEQNVLNEIKIYLDNPTFVSKKMYYKTINRNITRYYVSGIVEQNVIHDYDPIEKESSQYMYFIVNLDSKKGIFTIEPYDGTLFMDGEKNEK